MKNVLVFGGSGFIGRAVMKKLVLREAYRVFNFDLDPIACATFATPCTGNITSYRTVLDLIESLQPDIIYNLAGMAHLDDCTMSPAKTMQANVGGHTNVLEALWHVTKAAPYVPEKVIYASSLYVYARGDNPYTISKQAAEALTRYYCKNLMVTDYVILRYGTVYGPGANDRNSIYRLVKHALETGVISYYGTGEEVRQYIHVDDVARLSVNMAESKVFDNKEVVLTGAYPTKAADMVHMLRDILGSKYKVEFRNEPTPDHYVVTPYAYQPDVAATVPVGPAYDLAGGLLEVVREADVRLQKGKGNG